MKYLTALVLSALAAAGCTPSRAPTTNAVEAIADETVALVLRDDEGAARAYCAGVWVSPSAIITAAHCVADLEPTERVEYVISSDVYAPVSTAPRKVVGGHGAEVYAADAGHDLALLRAVNAPPHAVARVALDTIRPGSRVRTMGHPHGLWWSFSSGDVSALRTLDVTGVDTVWTQVTVPINRGNSGGGLFDTSGNLVGVCSSMVARTQNVGLFVHAQYVDAFVRRQGGAL